jgi:L-cysteine S-thiosulfotransferase
MAAAHLRRVAWSACTLVLLLVGFASEGDTIAAEVGVASYTADGDAIAEPLDGRVGIADRGRALVLDRERGNCLICHQVPVDAERSQGDLAPTLAGVGSRLNAGQIRMRLVDQSQLNAATLMPAYHRVAGLTRVAPRYIGQPVFSAQEVEDVVAWLATLKD